MEPDENALTVAIGDPAAFSRDQRVLGAFEIVRLVSVQLLRGGARLLPDCVEVGVRRLEVPRSAQVHVLLRRRVVAVEIVRRGGGAGERGEDEQDAGNRSHSFPITLPLKPKTILSPR